MYRPILTSVNDAQSLNFVVGETFRVNSTVIEARYPDWDFSRLVFVDTTGPEWSPGVMTYTSNISGRAEYITGYAKDMPFADVSQDRQMQTFDLAGIGYQYNIEEINTALQIGGSLSDRRARAARMTYMKFMWDLVIGGNALKGRSGLINYPGVTSTLAPDDGTGGAREWVNNAGVGQKTPAQIVRDINIALGGIYTATNQLEMADTILLPFEAYLYIAQTPFSATTMETILSFVQRTNIYTLQTGRPLTILALPTELRTAGAGGTGRLVAYRNDPTFALVHLPMSHRFLPVYQDGWANFVIPGIFRTGGLELTTLSTVRYLDAILPAP